MPDQTSDVLDQGVALALLDRDHVDVVGADRAALLHNFCTNDVSGLAPGQGCEAFLTSAQGRILGHLLIFCHADHLVVDTVAGQASKVVAHLERYIIREQVELHDRSNERRELLVAGPEAPRLLAALTGAAAPADRLSHAEVNVAGQTVSVRRVDFVEPHGYFLVCAAPHANALRDALLDAGAVPLPLERVEAARIEAGFPCYGRDITDANLPQEVGRDERAISLRKGCYLGQETVARIDALGHVNRHLVGVRFRGDEVPPPGVPLSADGREVGHVTTAAWSPRLGAPLALAYVRRGHHLAGTRLDCSHGDAEVVSLPVTWPDVP